MVGICCLHSILHPLALRSHLFGDLIFPVQSKEPEVSEGCCLKAKQGNTPAFCVMMGTEMFWPWRMAPRARLPHNMNMAPSVKSSVLPARWPEQVNFASRPNTTI